MDFKCAGEFFDGLKARRGRLAAFQSLKMFILNAGQLSQPLLREALFSPKFAKVPRELKVNVLSHSPGILSKTSIDRHLLNQVLESGRGGLPRYGYEKIRPTGRSGMDHYSSASCAAGPIFSRTRLCCLLVHSIRFSGDTLGPLHSQLA